ncbi:MAG: hypothetical protein ACKO1Y_10310 [Actinomycetota bacterium]
MLRHTAVIALVAAATAVVVGAIALGVVLTRPAPEASVCRVVGDALTFDLGLEEAANATTIAAVVAREGLPPRALTVALATAYQESNLRNLDYGDRDSVGLFQQRPSQGWGARADLLRPEYATAAFLRELRRVDGWSQLRVTEAAQAVQRSAGPEAYARWEARARVLAAALTGPPYGRFSCRTQPTEVDDAAARRAIAEGLRRDLGVSDPDGPLPRDRAWLVASWLVAHASATGVTEVEVDGRRWSGELEWERIGRPAADAGAVPVRFRTGD